MTDKLHGEGVLVVGDSGGFVNPITGGGIFLGMKSAEAAAKTACEGLHMNRTGRPLPGPVLPAH
ncbi:MAG: hypothetical protein M5R36_21480 [Deltaproteobacteria bacterium]|nr:hypothetical protein [Deltaproteobacteria bacterium]